MKYYGVEGKTNTWIEDFLTGQSQRVVLDGEKSYNADVLSGVPQGSVLGPCLFLFYINDMPEGLHQETTVRLFADDTIAYLAVTNNRDAKKLQEWKIICHFTNSAELQCVLYYSINNI